MMLTIRLEKTCEACPEQYDAFIDDTKVAYLRMRHGHFRVDVPDCQGETIYQADPCGDGAFEDEEREWYLDRAKEAIRLYYLLRMLP